MAAAEQINTELDITRVASEVFAVLRRNFATYAILALVLTGLPTAILYGIWGDAMSGNWRALGASMGSQIYWSMLGGLVTLVTTLVLQAAIIVGTVNELSGKPVSVSEGLQTGLRSFLPLIAIGIMFGLAVACGMVLLVVPGIMLAVAWCVTIPAFVIEQTSITGSFGRSLELTRGSRWQIFALLLLYAVISIIIQAVLGAVGGMTSFVMVGHFPLVTRLVVFPVIAVAKALIGATGAAVLYVELRRIREGVEPKGLAALFE